jgi:hypothetical protein
VDKVSLEKGGEKIAAANNVVVQEEEEEEEEAFNHSTFKAMAATMNISGLTRDKENEIEKQ